MLSEIYFQLVCRLMHRILAPSQFCCGCMILKIINPSYQSCVVDMLPSENVGNVRTWSKTAYGPESPASLAASRSLDMFFSMVFRCQRSRTKNCVLSPFSTSILLTSFAFTQTHEYAFFISEGYIHLFLSAPEVVFVGRHVQ